MECKKCGFNNLDEANFCIKCGARLDEKIPCPKCGEYIPNDVDHCPNCGKAIPHKKEEVIEKNAKLSDVKVRASSVFNRVSCFVTLFLFIYFIGVSFSKILYSPSVDYSLTSFSFIHYLFEEFKNFYELVILDQSLVIVRCIIVAMDIIVTITASIFGITKVKAAFKDRSLIHVSYKFLAIVLCAKLLTTTLLIASYENPGAYSVSSSLSSGIALAIVHLTACLAFDCFLNFKRGQVSIFIARIILGLGVFLPMLIIVSFTNATYSFNGFIYNFVNQIYLLANNLVENGFISIFIFDSINTLLSIAILSVAYSIVVFLVASYFRGMNKFKKFRITFYMATISLAILATSYLVAEIVETVLFSNFVGNAHDLSLTAGYVFTLTVLLFGVAVTTFNIYSRFDRRRKLEEKTTVK